MSSALHDSIDALTAAILGALQGITEFLPVSSSGHVAVGAAVFGLEDAPLALTVLLHAGTLAATVWLFRQDIAHLTRDAVVGLKDPRAFLRTESGHTVWAVVIAMAFTIVIALALRDVAEAWSHDLFFVGVCFLGSAAAVLLTRFKHGTSASISVRGAIAVGIAQGLAVLPGFSRSGFTIAAAMGFGSRESEAFRFSFLLSIPAVLAAMIWELRDVDVWKALGPEALLGGLVAFVLGYLSLILLRRILMEGRLWMFAFYLVPLGFGLIFAATRG